MLLGSGSRRGYTLAEMAVVVIVLGLIGAVVVPQFSRAGVTSHEDELKDQMRTVRAAVELYRAQHRDAAPDLSKDWTALTSRSDASGTIGDGKDGQPMFGPYLPTPPKNPLTGGSRVSDSPDRGVDWWWDASTATITALDPNGVSWIEEQ